MMNEMKGRTATTLFCIAVGILIFVLITTKDSFRIEMGKEEPLVMNRQEKQFVENHNSITLHVDKDLHYLGIDFLQEYIQMIMNPTGLKVKLSEGNPKHMDGSIQIVTDQLRKQVGDIYFSAPVIQTSGSMFVRKELLHDRESKTILDGVMIQDYLTTHQLKTLSYNGRGISVNAVGSAKEAVTLADKEGMDCIIGNQEAIVYELRKQNLQDKFIDTDSNFRTQNVSIVTGKQKPQLAGLINQCVQKADKELLLLYAEEKHGNRPSRLLEENRYGNMAVLLSIIISAVFITFFFYYQSNKNLYNELTARMNQLTASKKELSTTFDRISYYMAELDPEGFILDINQAFLHFVDRECVGRHLSTVLDFPEEGAAVLKRLLDAAETGGKHKKEEVQVGKSILEIEVFPIDDPKGNVEKMLFMADDVTGVRMAERQLLQDNKMIAVGQLAAGVAHEIRNPLGVIRNYCYVLKNMDDEDTQKQAIQAIERSVDTSGKIIENLLNFSRVSHRTVESFLIKKHIDDLLFLNEGKLKKKSIFSQVKCKEDFMVALPEESFDMILLNLISNGIDAMNEGGTITIEVEYNRDDVVLNVTDTGCGIPEEIQEEIFNPFYTTKYKTEGNGLGLYIVYNEVTKMNGKIELQSKVDEGTTFTVTLPVQLEGQGNE